MQKLIIENDSTIKNIQLKSARHHLGANYKSFVTREASEAQLYIVIKMLECTGFKSICTCIFGERREKASHFIKSVNDLLTTNFLQPYPLLKGHYR